MTYVGRSIIACLAFALGSYAAAPASAPLSAKSKLHLEEVGSDSMSFDVVSTLIVGPTELLVWDAQYHLADAKRLADRIAATGKRLKAIVISHPDHDHYTGAATLVERFPGTPVYMTAVALQQFQQNGRPGFESEKSRRPTMMPDSLVTPQLLPSSHLTVDGEAVEVIPDLTGDVLTPSNSVLWIPSLKAVLAGDVAFNGIHLWLGSSSEASRAAWRASLQQIRQLQPAVVVAGHKKDIDAPDSPNVLEFMDQYLADFDTLRKSSANAQELVMAMFKKYPDLGVRMLVPSGARAAFTTAGKL